VSDVGELSDVDVKNSLNSISVSGHLGVKRLKYKNSFY
jgi:hypothetical protein